MRFTRRTTECVKRVTGSVDGAAVGVGDATATGVELLGASG